MDRDDSELLLSESEEGSPSDETSSLDASSPISLQSRVHKHLCFFRTKLKKVIYNVYMYMYIRSNWQISLLGYVIYVM